MSSDPERNEETAEARPSQPRRVGLPQDSERRSRSLGRGFEDIAETFLSRKPAVENEIADEAPRPAVRETPPRETPPREPAPTGGPLLVRSGMRATKDQVVTALKNYVQEIEPGLRFVDAAVPCGPAGEIDLLAVDRATRLVIVNVSIESDATLLLQSLAQADWVTSNIAVVRRMYQGQLVDFSQEPRICLVAPRFSGLVESAVRHVTNKVLCLAFRDLELTGRIGITLERAGAID